MMTASWKNMERVIVGSLAEIGRKKTAMMYSIIAARDRAAAVRDRPGSRFGSPLSLTQVKT